MDERLAQPPSREKASVEQLLPQKLPAETIILGFTGSLGSGCTYLSEEVARLQDFLHYELSTPIRDQAKSEHDESYQNKQKIGNKLRQEGGLGVLAVKAIEFADKTWAEQPAKFNGIDSGWHSEHGRGSPLAPIPQLLPVLHPC